MTDVDVTVYDSRDYARLEISTENIVVDVAAKDEDDFERLLKEIFGDAGTLAGQELRKLLEDDTKSGLSIPELFDAARDRARNNN